MKTPIIIRINRSPIFAALTNRIAYLALLAMSIALIGWLTHGQAWWICWPASVIGGFVITFAYAFATIAIEDAAEHMTVGSQGRMYRVSDKL